MVLHISNKHADMLESSSDNANPNTSSIPPTTSSRNEMTSPPPRKRLSQSPMCHDCPETFSTTEELEKHVQMKHNEKRYKCHINGCGYSTDNKSRFGDHERVHTGEKPFSCRYCEKKYANQSNRINHERKWCSKNRNK